MSKKLFFLLGLLTGVLLIELFYRPLKARLKLADAAEAERQRFNAFLEKDQQDYYNSLSPEKKMEYTVRMADWDDEEEDEDETEE
jgi:hypothetical protein